MHRRSLLKAGALAALIALTLHGGVPLAHANSSGSCVWELIQIANSSGRSAELQVPINTKSNKVANAAHGHAIIPSLDDYGPNTQLVPFDGSEEHWNFIASSPNRFGFSCLSSATNIKIKGNNGWGNGHQPPPGFSCEPNSAENYSRTVDDT